MKHTRLTYVTIAIAFLMATFPAFSAWQLPVLNYSPKDYGAGTQNWQLSFQSNGWLYAANNYGLLEYDGSRWYLYGLNNATVVRSIEVSPWGDVFAGGTNDFGYFRPNSNGEMQYFPLADSIPQEYRKFGEVWNMVFNEGRLYVQTRHYIFAGDYVLSDERTCKFSNIRVLELQQRVFCMATVNDNVYVGAEDGIYLLAGYQFNLLNGSELLKGCEIRSMQPLGNNKVLIATDMKGLFMYDGNAIQPFKTDADGFLRKSQLYTLAVGENSIAIGTVLQGVVMTDLNGHNCRYFSQKNGMGNNTVLSLCFDGKGGLWAGLDQGIDYIQLSSKLQYLQNDDVAFGSGYTSCVFNNKLYLGTNQGLYCTSILSADNLQLVGGSLGQVWRLCVLNNELLCCHNRGLFRLAGDRLEPLSLAEGFWNVKPLDATHALAGSYSGFYMLEYGKGGWNILWKIDGFSDTALRFEIDKTGRVWVVAQGGLECLVLRDDRHSFSSSLVKPYSELDGWINMGKVGGNVVITANGFCRVVQENGTLEQDSNLFDLLDGETYYSFIDTDDNGNIWYVNGNELKMRVRKTDRQYEERSKCMFISDSRFVGGFENVSHVDSRHALVGIVDGYCLIDASDAADRTIQENSSVYVRRVRFLSQDKRTVFRQSWLLEDLNIEVPYDSYSVAFEFAGADVPGEECRYAVRLLPLEKSFSQYSTLSRREYAALKEGQYIFEVKALNPYSGVESAAVLQFTIRPPWYKTVWAYMLYSLIGILLIVFVIYFIYLVYEREKRKLEQQKNAEMREQEKLFMQERHEQEMRILQLENEHAQYDLKNKSQELSHLLLNQLSRNELVTNVLNELRKTEDELRQQQTQAARDRLRKLQEKLSRTRNDDIDWKQFEENFDIVNDKLMRKLSQKFPWMSKSERRLCVYIHMGLLTKEIAPLMNMSTRGLEMMRYRLRRKMNLGEQVNLKEYFASLAAEDMTITTEKAE